MEVQSNKMQVRSLQRGKEPGWITESSCRWKNWGTIPKQAGTWYHVGVPFIPAPFRPSNSLFILQSLLSWYLEPASIYLSSLCYQNNPPLASAFNTKPVRYYAFLTQLIFGLLLFSAHIGVLLNPKTKYSNRDHGPQSWRTETERRYRQTTLLSSEIIGMILLGSAQGSFRRSTRATDPNPAVRRPWSWKQVALDTATSNSSANACCTVFQTHTGSVLTAIMWRMLCCHTSSCLVSRKSVQSTNSHNRQIYRKSVIYAQRTAHNTQIPLSKNSINWIHLPTYLIFSPSPLTVCVR